MLQLLTALTAVVATSAPEIPKAGVEYVIGERDYYPIEVGGDGHTVALWFEVPCDHHKQTQTGYFNLSFRTLQNEGETQVVDPQHAFVWVDLKGSPTGLPAGEQIVLICNPYRIALRPVVGQPGMSTVSFRVSKDTADQVQAARTTARLEAEQACQDRRRNDALVHEAEVQRFLMRSLRDSAERDVSETGKDGNLKVYVKRARRAGDYGILEMELVNSGRARSGVVMHLDTLSVAALGTDYVAERVLTSTKRRVEIDAQIHTQTRKEVTEALQEGTAALQVDLGSGQVQQTWLDPGEIIKGSVMFPFPWLREGSGEVSLTVRTTAGEQAVVETIRFEGIR